MVGGVSAYSWVFNNGVLSFRLLGGEQHVRAPVDIDFQNETITIQTAEFSLPVGFGITSIDFSAFESGADVTLTSA